MGFEGPTPERGGQFPEKPKGWRWLSVSLELATHIPTHSYEKKVALFQDAIGELRNLEGGEEVFQNAYDAFEETHGRKPGDVESARIAFEEKHPDLEGWTNDEFIEREAKDWEELAFALAGQFDGDNNPRTPEFIEAVQQQVREQAEGLYTEHTNALFQRRLDPAAFDYHREPADTATNFVERWGMHWDDMDFEDSNQNVEATIEALEHFPGHSQAQRLAELEWEALEALLQGFETWHGFADDRENYIVRRTNELLGSPLELQPFVVTKEQFEGGLSELLVQQVDCDLLIKFAESRGIDRARELVLEKIKDVLINELAHQQKMAGQELELPPDDGNLERFVSRLHRQLDSPIAITFRS